MYVVHTQELLEVLEQYNFIPFIYSKLYSSQPNKKDYHVQKV